MLQGMIILYNVLSRRFGLRYFKAPQVKLVHYRCYGRCLLMRWRRTLCAPTADIGAQVMLRPFMAGLRISKMLVNR